MQPVVSGKAVSDTLSDISTKSNVLITGATGFIGRRLVAKLEERSAGAIYALARDAERIATCWPTGSVQGRVGDLAQTSSLADVCRGVDTVFHLAGYAHRRDVSEQEEARQHLRITVEGTEALLAAAVRAGVRRFVFASSVKAMGEGGERLTDESQPSAPSTSYGRAKLAAEQAVLAARIRSGMHVCVLRLPMVYGPGNKGNLPRMIRAVDCHRFPPLPDTGNKRSMVHVDDVVEALLLAAERPEAAGRTYIVTDEQVYSTRRIYALICSGLGRSVPRWTVPLGLLKVLARVGDWIGKARRRPFAFNSETLYRLVGSAWYSSARIARELGYRPTRTLENALPEMIVEYRNSQTPEKRGARSVPR